MAGVEAILMSLGEIQDDGPTKLFMKEFYSNYRINLMYTTHDLIPATQYAFDEAVKAVKLKYPSFSDWGKFIIIDAIRQYKWR